MYSPTANNNRQNNQERSRLFEEISILMRASGDADASLQQRDSIVLVEKILIQQLRLVLDIAIDVVNFRTNNASSLPTIEDFDYLLHRNKPKLIRFHKYMKNVQKIQVKNEQKKAGGVGAGSGDFGLNFLNRISEDNTDEDDEEEVFDSEKLRRM